MLDEGFRVGGPTIRRLSEKCHVLSQDKKPTMGASQLSVKAGSPLDIQYLFFIANESGGICFIEIILKQQQMNLYRNKNSSDQVMTCKRVTTKIRGLGFRLSCFVDEERQIYLLRVGLPPLTLYPPPLPLPITPLRRLLPRYPCK